MKKRTAKTRSKSKKGKSSRPASPFAPAAFLSGSPEAVQELCQAIATKSAKSFADLTGTTWDRVATSIVDQLRSTGHDFMSIEETDGVQEWRATWYHPRGVFSLFLSFHAPNSVEVTWKTEDREFVARGLNEAMK